MPDAGLSRGEREDHDHRGAFAQTVRIPLQVAWQEMDVPQCGYCQAGQMMSAAALLAKTPKPTDDDIDTAMNGNLCRCGTYIRIRKAMHRAAEIARERRRNRCLPRRAEAGGHKEAS